MNAEFESIMNEALLETISYVGESISINGVAKNAVVNAATFTEDLLDGGLQQKRGITVVIPADIEEPKVGSKLIYKGKVYRIMEVVEDSVSFELRCETDAK